MKRGFTLIELLVVISIISLLSSVVLASVSLARIKAEDAKMHHDGRQLETAVELEYEKTNKTPYDNRCPTGCTGAEVSYSDYDSTLANLVTDGAISTLPQPPAGLRFGAYAINQNLAAPNYYACGTQKVGKWAILVRATVSTRSISGFPQFTELPVNAPWDGFYCIAWDKLSN